MRPFALPGYDVVEMLGFGSSAEVWLAQDRTSGESVALKRLHVATDPPGRARLHREVAVLTAVRHPHVVRMRQIVETGEEIVLVLDHAPGGSLTTLLAARGTLTAGEVVTLAVPLCQALTAIAAVGLAHGDVSPGNVLFSAIGQPLLSDFGVAQILGASSAEIEATAAFLDPAVLAGAAPGPAADVYSLGRVCLAALGAPDLGGVRADVTEEALRAVFQSATSAKPDDRPTAAELAVAVYQACRAEPIRVASSRPHVLPAAEQVTHRVRRVSVPVAAASPPTRARKILAWLRGKCARPQAMRALRPVVGAMLVVLVGLLAVRLGAAWAASDVRVTQVSERPSAPASLAQEPDGWADVLRHLDETRSAAFAQTDPEQLARVYADRSPALQRDRLVLADLVASGRKARGVRLDIRSVEVHAESPKRVVLKVRDVMPRYELLGEDGTVLATRKGRPTARWLVTLVRGEGDWQVYDVVRG